MRKSLMIEIHSIFQVLDELYFQSEESSDPTQSLQKSMLGYLASNSESEPAYWYARSFYIAQWYRDTTVEAEKKMKASGDNDGDFDETEAEMSTEIMENQEKRKKFLSSQIDNIQPSDQNFRYIHYFSNPHVPPEKLNGFCWDFCTKDL